MDPNRKVLQEALRAFKAQKDKPRGGATLLLEAIRSAAFEYEKDDDAVPPDELRVGDVVKRAASLAARQDPDQPLDQVLSRKLLWTLFKTLEAARLGEAVPGRRGAPSRFVFKTTVTGKALRGALDAVGIQQRSLDDSASPPRVPATAAAAEARDRPSSDVLDRDRVVALLRDHGDDLRRLGVTELSLFGSVARNEARPDSDVDLLASFQRPLTSDMFFGTKFFLEDLLCRRVDLLTDAALHGRIRSSIESELVRVA
jgi:predicted nucleotidyltransferase